MKTACQSSRRSAQVGERADRVVDAVLRAHDAEVAEQVLAAAGQRGLGGAQRGTARRPGALRTTNVSSTGTRPRPVATAR